MATSEERTTVIYKSQVPNEQFVYKTTPQQRPPLYNSQNFIPQMCPTGIPLCT